MKKFYLKILHASRSNSKIIALVLGCFISLLVPGKSFATTTTNITIFAPGAAGSPNEVLTISPGSSVTCKAVVTGGGDCAYTFQWQLNNKDIIGAFNDTYTSATLSTGDKITCKLIFKDANCKPATSNHIAISVTTPAENIRETSLGCVVLVTVKADYCAIPGKVLLKATSSVNGSSFLWNTGETTSNIQVDIGGNYTVTASKNGCTGSGPASITVGQELVINGDFESGNTGFTSPALGGNQYQYRADIAGNSELNPEGLYGIGTDAQNYHSNFWGFDHTTGSGNYMIVNGFPGSPQPKIWQQTVKVMPNIVYYFSGWGKSLNKAGNYAQLQFNVNGQQVGNVAVLPAGVNNNTNSNWTRFYGTLTTGPTDTIAVISITDLQTATAGNDFGLDDISFGTLATFIKLESAPGTDGQTVCVNTSLTNIVYSVGSTDSVPVITGLPPGLTTSFDGIYFTISGNPTVAGYYPYTITTSGTCNRTSASGFINVVKESITLNSDNSSPSVCINTPVNINYTLSGTSTNATASGLPTGVSLSVSGSAVTISGIPTVSGSFPYTITTIGSCAQATATGTITVNPTISISTVAQNATLCPQPFSALSTSFSVAAADGTTYQWQENPGSGWTNLSNGGNYNGVTSNTLTVNNITELMEGYQYRTLLNNASACYLANSTPNTLTITNVWKGTAGSNWGNAANWWGDVVPDINCQYVIVPNVSPNYFPVLTGTETQEVRNIVIRKDASVTVTGSATLQVRGAIYADIANSTFGYLDGINGRIELTGGTSHTYSGTDTAQIIAGSLFKTRTLKDLKITNPLSATVKSTAGDTLNITGILSFGNVNNATLHTGNNITLISNANGTAALADITNNLSNSGNSINGDVIVERYINTGTGVGQHGKAWEFMATPTTGQTVKQSWMENGSLASTNYGTQITGSGGTAAGYDLYSADPSMKFYNPNIASEWEGISNPGISIYNPKGYMVFVRGDRSIPGPFTPAIPTRLRTKGKLFTYNVTIPLATNVFSSIGNPYASAIDMRKVVAQSPDVDKFFTLWISALEGNFGYGAYVTYSLSGSNFVSTPGGVTNNTVESGRAFFVQSAAGNGGNILFNETSKGANSSVVSRKQGTHGKIAQLRTNLYGINASGTYLADGTLHEFSDTFNTVIDRNDARKLFNSAENLVIFSQKKSLIIERTKTPTEKDTLFFNLTGVAKQKYRFEFVSKGMPASELEGYVEDKYLNNCTPLNMEDTTVLEFTVNNTQASYSPSRFRIVFKALPVTITSFSSQPKGRDVQVEWNVIHEKNMQQYEIERSVDGINFTKQQTLAATNEGSSNYNWLNKNLLPGYYYYRIRSIDNNGKTEYTEKAKILVGNGRAVMVVAPNPIDNGIIHLQMLNMPGGKYGFRLRNNLGQVIISKQIERNEGSNIETINLARPVSRGVYQLEVTQPGGELKNIKVVR